VARIGFYRFTSCVTRNCPARKRPSFKHLLRFSNLSGLFCIVQCGICLRQHPLALMDSDDCNWKNAIAGQVRMDLEPGRIGFMSTQRRENRWQRRNCTQRAETSSFLDDRSMLLVWKVSGNASPGPVAQHGRAYAKVGTAPVWLHPSDKDLSPGAPDWLATNSLQSDYNNLQIARQNIRRSSPPPGAGCCAAFATSATYRSSLPRFPSPSGFVCLHSTLPQFPAGKRRWMERYDGKGNLHLLYAA
jgi:hypothetical protein